MSTENTLYPWQQLYPNKIGLLPRGDLDILPDCAWIMPGTAKALNQWRDGNMFAQMNIVLVSPNEGNLPMRSLSYVINALRIIRSLKTTGINLNRLRIINPCYLNVYGDGGDLNRQLRSGQEFGDNLKKWIEESVVDLKDLEISIDTGKEIPEDKELFKKSHDFTSRVEVETTRSILGRVNNHSQTGQSAALYLYGHPIAWQYKQDERLFDAKQKSSSVVNFMPQSELLFLLAMKQAGVILSPEKGGVVTIVSKNIISAPYYFLESREPLLDWSNISQSAIQTLRQQFKKTPLAGSLHGKEIMGSLGNILKFIQTGS